MTNPPSDYDPAAPSSAGTVPTYPVEESPGVGEPFTETAATAAPSFSGEWPPDRVQDSAVEERSTTDVAKDEASNVKDTAVDAGKNVAATAKDEAANVAAETKQQAKSLLSSVTSEVQTQAGTQQQKIAESVHALSTELGGMASGSSESGPLTDLAQQAADKAREIADWLESREPRDVLREVESYARRRPVMFLALCGLAGVVAGRITRGAVAANTSIDSPSADNRTIADTSRRELDSAPQPASLVDEELSSSDVTATGVADGSAGLGYVESPGYGSIGPDDRVGGVR